MAGSELGCLIVHRHTFNELTHAARDMKSEFQNEKCKDNLYISPTLACRRLRSTPFLNPALLLALIDLVERGDDPDNRFTLTPKAIIEELTATRTAP